MTRNYDAAGDKTSQSSAAINPCSMCEKRRKLPPGDPNNLSRANFLMAACASKQKSLYDGFDFGRTTGPLLAGAAGARSDIPPKSANQPTLVPRAPRVVLVQFKK
jgi:hypothetical protein